MNKTVLVLLLSLPCILAAGGMAELKSITGDTPYQGIGNAPAFLPQPMGFWGRPRLYPGYPYEYGSGGWYSGDGGRFTSVSGGPYASRTGYTPINTLYGSNRRSSPYNFHSDPNLLNIEQEDFTLGAPTFSGPAVDTADNSALNLPTVSSPNEIPRSFPVASDRTSFSRPSSPSVSLRSATGGGFYKGRGNN